MELTIHLFGHYADLFEKGQIKMTLPEGATVKELLVHLQQADPKLSSIGAHCRIAIDEEYAKPERVLQEENIVALIPPMSGG